jgi:hypothetical protein
VRRAVGREWPALSRLYGLHPWDVGGPRYLTFLELGHYRRALREEVERRTAHDGR